MKNLVGQQLGRYKIGSEIGRGGMGVVYRAFDPQLGRDVAVKVLNPYLSSDRECVARFSREARSAAGLHHPNIVPIFDIGAQAGWHYLVMQYLPGQPLSRILKKQGALSPDRAARIIAQVASALDYAHDQRLVHRDLKPANIIIGSNDHATLTDFGIVHAADTTRLTQQGVSLGTPAYMSPEQVRGEDVGPEADVYALGILGYEMLTGRPPFLGDTVPVLHAQVYETPQPLRRRAPQLSGELEAVVHRALAKDPQQRWPSAGAMAQAFREAVVRLPPPIRSGSTAVVPGAKGFSRGLGLERFKRTPWAIGGAAVVVAVVLALILIVGLGGGTTNLATATPRVLSTQSLVAVATTSVPPTSRPTVTVMPTPIHTQGLPTPSTTPSPPIVPTPSKTPVPSHTPTASNTPTDTPTPTPTDAPKPACRNPAKGWIGFKRQKRCNPQNGDGCGPVVIWVMKANGSGQAPMCDPKVYNRALVRDRTAKDDAWRLEVAWNKRDDIARVHTADGRVEWVIVNNRRDWDPALSADNWWLAWVTNRNANDEIYIKTLDLKDQNQRRLTVNDWEWDKHPTWSPDGRKIAFYSNRAKKLQEATRQIWVMDIVDDQGENLRNLSQRPDQVDSDPVWFKWDKMP